MGNNTNDAALKDFVDRMFNIEDEFRNAKLERSDLVKDLMAEVKARKDETGVDPADVKRLVRIRLDETAVRDETQQLNDDLATYDLLYGESTRGSEDAGDDPF